jgi:N-acetylmuramoyl-L-alanine amidase
MAKKPLKNIIIHCSDSEFGCAAEIRRWHTAQGWKDIGYNFVIPNGLILPQTSYQTRLFIPSMDGSLEIGRKVDGDAFIDDNEVGAHALGYNATSIGICLIGVKDFTSRQFFTLGQLLSELYAIYNKGRYLNTRGHGEVCPGRTCPNFDVQRFLRTNNFI